MKRLSLALLAAFSLCFGAAQAHAQVQLPDSCSYFELKNDAGTFAENYINSYGLSFWPPIDHGTLVGVNCSDPGTGPQTRNITYHQTGTNLPDFWQMLLGTACYQVGSTLFYETQLNWKPNQVWSLFANIRCSCQKRAHAPWDPGSCGWY